VIVKVISVNVGLPREVQWKGRVLTTGFFKEPVSGRLAVREGNLDGDGQADLRVHGGIEKAIYLYPAEHYGYWQNELPGAPLPWGSFGENLTTKGLLEDAVHIGDRYRIGSAEFKVTQHRQPCYKLSIRFGRDDIVKRFLLSGRSGFYLAVVKEGDVGAGDALELVHRDASQLTVAASART
jgi:MOSC domain-containing protein YiiM